MIYSLRAQREVNKSRIHEVTKIFRMGDVSELWFKTMVNNSHVFNLSSCSVAFKM